MNPTITDPTIGMTGVKRNSWHAEAATLVHLAYKFPREFSVDAAKGLLAQNFPNHHDLITSLRPFSEARALQLPPRPTSQDKSEVDLSKID